MTSNTDDSTTRSGLWVVFSTVTALLVALIIWVLQGADTSASISTGQNAQQQAHPAAGSESTPEAVAEHETDLDTDNATTTAQAQLSGAVYFESASDTLPADAEAAIMAAVTALQASDNKRVILAGYHDATGNQSFNQQLAKKRAIAVRDALVVRGIAVERIALRKPEQTTGTGKQAEARRVEIWLAD